MLPTRFDPNSSTGYHRTTFTLHCARGHQWEVHGFNELGGGFLDNEDHAQCPECGLWEGESTPEEEA